MSKMGDPRAVGVLLKFLDSHLKELRLPAIIGLAWNRARVALEPLERMETDDPDPDVRREAQVAIEEILRDFPNLRSMLKNHKPILLTRENVIMDSESTIANLQPLTDEHRQFLVARLPRLLALRYKAVPLFREAHDALVIAVPADPEFERPVEALERVTGCAIELRGWPLNKIYERLLTFYEWGDDDWVQFSPELTDAALCEIAEIVLEGIAPEAPHSPLPDCSDSIELIQSFLSQCVQRRALSAVLEGDGEERTFTVTLNLRGGEREELEPPPPHLRERFIRALKMIADCEEQVNEAGQLVGRGSIRTNNARMDKPFVAVVRCETMDEHCIMAIEFVDLEAN